MNDDGPLVRLSRALGLGDSPRQTTRLVRDVYREIDAEVTAGARGLSLPCRMGCDACCHEAVFLSGPEFLVVAEHLLDSWGDSDLRAVVDAMQEISVRYEDELELLETIEGRERDEVARRVRFSCPFLSASGTCRIYPVRELNARTFGLSWDELRGDAFGCELTHERLRVLGSGVGGTLAGARAARQRLVGAVAGTEQVHVYPWWFSRYRRFFG